LALPGSYPCSPVNVTAVFQQHHIYLFSLESVPRALLI